MEVDVVPVLYEGEPHDVGYLVSKDDGTRLRTSVRQHLDFIRGRKAVHPRHLAQLIRFTKWWARQQKRRDGEFKCKSFMLDLWVHLADGGMDLSDYAVALERFFLFIASDGLDQQIAFTDYHPRSALPARGSAPIQVLDPVNLPMKFGPRRALVKKILRRWTKTHNHHLAGRQAKGAPQRRCLLVATLCRFRSVHRISIRWTAVIIDQ